MNDKNIPTGFNDDGFVFDELPKHYYKFKPLFKAFLNETIAHNDMVKLMQLVLDHDHYRFVCAAMISLKQSKSDVPEHENLPAKNIDKDIELEMLITYFLNHEICHEDLIRLFNIIIEDNHAYTYCKFSREF